MTSDFSRGRVLVLCFEKYIDAEKRRLEQKADIMRVRPLTDLEAHDDAMMRAKNDGIMTAFSDPEAPSDIKKPDYKHLVLDKFDEIGGDERRARLDRKAAVERAARKRL